MVPYAAVRKAFAVAVLLLFTFALLEGASRLLAVALRPSQCTSPTRCLGAFVRPDPVLAFYPKLRDAAKPGGDDDTLDVLLLGGSVLHPEWSPFGSILADRLSLATRRRVRIDNLADSSQTSLDSRLKYERLAERHYDLVVFYHGINEARFNNVPREVFQADYAHIPWYAKVGTAVSDTWLPTLALPWAARHAHTLLSLRLGWTPSLPESQPDAWLAEGTDIKSSASFRANLAAIAATARSRGEPLVVATFAIHLPDDYSRKGFRKLREDYAQHLAPVKLWGRPEAVRAGVTEHNRQARELAATRDGVWLADADEALPRRRENFNDVCHLTVAGAVALADVVVPVALEALGAERQTPPPLD